MPTTPTHLHHLRVLEQWPAFAEQYWWTDPDRPELGCFGSGYNSWGVQTNQKFLGAYAVLATAPDLDEEAVGCSREQLLDRALRALRFSLASHVSGEHHCSDGTRWGHTWISLLGVERMMHGVAAIDEHLTDADRAALRRMLISEADAVLNLPVTGTKWAAEGGNNPEANIWNGAFLWRASRMYPDAPRVSEWIEKAHRFLLNGISMDADADDGTLIAGRALKDWHIGPNFFDNHALDHHGYLNVGYMVICLSNIAMLHFACEQAGWDAPESLYHHAEELWALVKRLIFADGRLLRIGGDTRQRYCYCQDYLLPSLLWAAHYLDDPHAQQLEAGNLELIRREQESNGDGSFLSQRCATIRNTNPYYYTRLESDKAVVLSMNAWWRRTLDTATQPPSEPFEESVAGSWIEPEHGAMFHRSPRRMASWSWRAAEPPQGLCLPPASGHLAEWCANMGGLVRLLGETGNRKCTQHDQADFDGGFLTTGAVADSEHVHLAEGWTGSDHALHQYAVAALPDDRTMVVLEYCRLHVRSYLGAVKGLKLNVPNDIFNGCSRTYHTASGDLIVGGTGDQLQELESRWLNVEDAIGAVGIYGADSFVLYQAGARRAAGYGSSLYYDEFCFPCRLGPLAVDAGTVVLDCGSCVLSGADAEETRQLAAVGVTRLACDDEGVRAVQVQATDGRSYALAVNFSNEAIVTRIEAPGFVSAKDVVTGASASATGKALTVELKPGQASLLVTCR